MTAPTIPADRRKTPVYFTVVIRDESPWDQQEPATYRRVTFTLTPEQIRRLTLRHDGERFASSFLEFVEDAR